MNPPTSTAQQELEAHTALLEKHSQVMAKMLAMNKEIKGLKRQLKASGQGKKRSASKKAKAPTAKRNKTSSTRKRAPVMGKATMAAGQKRVATVRNPRTGKEISVGDSQSRVFRQLVESARAEDFKQNRQATEDLIEVLALAQTKGVDFFDTRYIPARVQRWAAQRSGVALPAHLGGAASSEDERRPLLLKEKFAGHFWTYYVSMRNTGSPDSPFGRDILNDLASVQNIIATELKHIWQQRLNGTPFKFLMEYECMMSRQAFVVDGQYKGSAQTKPFTLSSVDPDSSEDIIPVVRSILQIDDEVSRAIAIILDAFEKFYTQGSGWTWVSSVGMTIKISRKIDGLPLNGDPAPILSRMNVHEHGVGESPESIVAETGGAFLPLPSWIGEKTQDGVKLKQMFFNPRIYSSVKSANDQCFSWACLRALNPYGPINPVTGHVQQDMSALDVRFRARDRRSNVADLQEGIDAGLIHHIQLPEGVSYPVSTRIDMLAAIEACNPFSLSVFLLGQRPGEIYPYYASKKRDFAGLLPHIRLGLIQSQPMPVPPTVNEFTLEIPGLVINSHYVWIKDLEGILGKRQAKYTAMVMSKDGKTAYRKQPHACDNCMNVFGSLRGLQEHFTSCVLHKPTRYLLPNENKRFLEFDKFRYLQRHPFVIYADTEAVNTPPADEVQEKGTAQVLSEHNISAWSYQIVIAPPYRHLFSEEPGWENRPFREIRSYVGPKAMSKFFYAIAQDTAVMEAIVKGPRGDVPLDYLDSRVKVMQEQAGDPPCRFCNQPMPPYAMMPNDFTAPGCPWSIDQKCVVDHDHFTGDPMGLAHSCCNIRASIKTKYAVPVIFHNLRGYDAYHILRNVDQWKIPHEPLADIDVIGKSMEKFTTISFNKRIRFIDSFQFVSAGLDTLVRNLANSYSRVEDKKTAFSILGTWYRYRWDDAHNQDKDFLNLIKKGIYPYELAHTVEELFATTFLPPKEHFFSKLSGEGVSDGCYRRAEWAWDYFRCESLADYTQAYVELDVLLLASVFEAFREAMLTSGHGLDPAHFVTAPSMAFQALLLSNLKRGVSVECFAECNAGLDGFRMAERGIRGGLCQVFRPFAESNPMLPCEAEATPPHESMFLDCGNLYGTALPVEGAALSGETMIKYLDRNNLYGEAMSSMLPEGDMRFEKSTDTEVSKAERELAISALEDGTKEKEEVDAMLRFHDGDMHALATWLMAVPDDAPRGFLLEVDLDYPESLHESHNDLPFCAENKPPPSPSEFTKQQFAQYSPHPSRRHDYFKGTKLIADLQPKRNYVIHYRLLKLALKHGLVLVKVHRVLSFKQSAWLAPYINFNTMQRRNSKNDVEKELWKLLSNAVFGKMMENVNKRRGIELISAAGWAKALKMASHPWMKTWRIIVPDNLIALEKSRTQVYYDRPILVGQAILDISKTIMYQFHYEIMRPHFAYMNAEGRIENRLTLLYTDTDSFVYYIAGLKGKSIHRDFYELYRQYDCFDLSEMQCTPLPDGFEGYTTDSITPLHEPLLAWNWGDHTPPLYFEKGKNAKLLGRMKDETFGVPIAKFLALRPKMYSVTLTRPMVVPHHNKKKQAMGKTSFKGEICKKKGIHKRLPGDMEKEYFCFDEYQRVFDGGEARSLAFASITHTKEFLLQTTMQTKIGLAPLDDKSYWFNSRCNVRYGHYLIKEYEDHMARLKEEDMLSEFLVDAGAEAPFHKKRGRKPRDKTMAHESQVDEMEVEEMDKVRKQFEEQSLIEQELMNAEALCLPEYLVWDPVLYEVSL